MWKILEKRPFFRADTARLGKYCTGAYGRIGVYRTGHYINHGEGATTQEGGGGHVKFYPDG